MSQVGTPPGTSAPQPQSRTGATPPAPASRGRRLLAAKVVIILAVGAVVWLLPAPHGVDPRGMHMAGVFVATILGLILQPLETASVALVGLAVAMVTGTMRAENEALVGFGNATVWLIAAAFFIADGFLITGLGRRIALWFVALLGRSSLGLSYGMTITDLLLAPATPSNTARAGGVMYPIIRSLSHVQGSEPDSDESRRRLGSYLMLTEVQVNAVTAAMFVTAMAGNPIAQAAAQKQGASISWGGWALAALVPGLVTLALVPWLMSKLYPPTLKQTPEAPRAARAELQELGRLSRGEIIMALTFVMLLLLWCLGAHLGINPTAAAFLGIAVLLVTGVLRWKDLAANASAWSTLIFFAVLVGMADQLNHLGVIGWVGTSVAGDVHRLGWPLALLVLCLVYFFSHYFFASNTAHIVAMYAVFLSAAIGAGAPPMLAALMLGFLGDLFGGLTHYSSGPSGVVYGSGYVRSGEWFRVGLVAGVSMLVVFCGVAVLWTRLLGQW